MLNPTEKQAPKLLDQVRDRIRVKHYSLRTEDAYLGWIKRFSFSFVCWNCILG